jgi:hypothetical protein
MNSDQARELARLALAALSARDRRALVLELAGRPGQSQSEQPQPARILTRSATADRLGHSTRYVDRLASEGILRRVTIPGRTRAAGFRESDIAALIGGAL